MIYLEEDILPSISFFRFCDEMLDYYRNDNSIYVIGGINELNQYEELGSYSYFFTNITSTLGIAIWKRTYNKFIKHPQKLVEDRYLNMLIKQKTMSGGNFQDYQKLYYIAHYNDEYSDKRGEEFDLMGISPNILYNQLAIKPAVNLIRHIGFDSKSEHMNELRLLPSSMKALENLELFELSFPLVHLDYKIQDEAFYKIAKSKSINRPKFFDYIERSIRILIFSGHKEFLKKLKKKFKEWYEYGR